MVGGDCYTDQYFCNPIFFFLIYHWRLIEKRYLSVMIDRKLRQTLLVTKNMSCISAAIKSFWVFTLLVSNNCCVSLVETWLWSIYVAISPQPHHQNICIVKRIRKKPKQTNNEITKTHKKYKVDQVWAQYIYSTLNTNYHSNHIHQICLYIFINLLINNHIVNTKACQRMASSKSQTCRFEKFLNRSF